jgi:hypothetical protein
MSPTVLTLKDSQYRDSVYNVRKSMFEDIEKSLRLQYGRLSNDDKPVGAPNFLLLRDFVVTLNIGESWY